MKLYKVGVRDADTGTLAEFYVEAKSRADVGARVADIIAHSRHSKEWPTTYRIDEVGPPPDNPAAPGHSMDTTAAEYAIVLLDNFGTPFKAVETKDTLDDIKDLGRHTSQPVVGYLKRTVKRTRGEWKVVD